MELLLGCGASRERRIGIKGQDGWSCLVTLDHNPEHQPDVVFDLEGIGQPLPDGSIKRLPFDDDTFDEIHAYEVLEHIGTQGDWRAFFAQFSELWRVLKPGGYLAATCPSYRSIWAWGDPSHRRIISSGTLVFLDQDQYAKQVGKTCISDFRHWYRADFTTAEEDGAWMDLRREAEGKGFEFVLPAVKPSRWKPKVLTTESERVQSLVT